MIPKIIHYCWFGRGKMPRLAYKCIKSWKKHLPDYEIKVWNEDNFDLDSCRYVAEAYKMRKFAFVTDYVRLYALFHEGGIYMDTDVEVLKPIDEFLAFEAFTGYESDMGCITGIMGSEKGGKWVGDLLSEYDNRVFILPDGRLNTTTNVKYTSSYMTARGMKLDGRHLHIPGLVTIFPSEYFCPKSWETGKISITENTHVIHHFAGSWWSPRELCVRWVRYHMGDRMAYIVAAFWRPPIVVVKGAFSFVVRKLIRVK